MLFKQSTAPERSAAAASLSSAGRPRRAERERDVFEGDVARVLRFLEPSSVRERLDAADDRLFAALRLGEAPDHVAAVLADPRVAQRIEALAQDGVRVRSWNTDANSCMHGVCLERSLEASVA